LKILKNDIYNICPNKKCKQKIDQISFGLHNNVILLLIDILKIIINSFIDERFKILTYN